MQYSKNLAKQINSITNRRISKGVKKQLKKRFSQKSLQLSYIRSQIQELMRITKYFVLIDSKIIDKLESEELGIPMLSKFPVRAIYSEGKHYLLSTQLFNEIKDESLILTDRTEKQKGINHENLINGMGKSTYLKGLIESIQRVTIWANPPWMNDYQIRGSDKNRILRKLDLEIKKLHEKEKAKFLKYPEFQKFLRIITNFLLLLSEVK